MQSQSLEKRVRPRLFDTHCHFDFQPFRSDTALSWQQTCDAGVMRLLIPSVGLSNWDTVKELTSIAPQQLFYALGFHPYFLMTDTDLNTDTVLSSDTSSFTDSRNMNTRERISHLETHLTKHDENCVAIGECGLDAVVDVPVSLQEEIFVAQLSIARDAGLPVILHSRKTQPRLLQLLKQHKFAQGGVLHAFSGSEQQAQAFIQLGFKIGIGGVITYPRAEKTRRTVARLPLDALVLETDAPDMPLYGMQGEYNHPKYLPLILQELAQLRDCNSADIAEALWRNSHQIFNLQCP